MILLPTDDCALYGQPPVADEHGFIEAPTEAAWEGRGSLQLAGGITGTDASDAGGHGPWGPASDALGTVYLPPESEAVDGMVLVSRDTSYTLSATHLVRDPIGAGSDAIVANVTEFDGWPL